MAWHSISFLLGYLPVQVSRETLFHTVCQWLRITEPGPLSIQNFQVFHGYWLRQLEEEMSMEKYKWKGFMGILTSIHKPELRHMTSRNCKGAEYLGRRRNRFGEHLASLSHLAPLGEIQVIAIIHILSLKIAPPCICLPCKLYIKECYTNHLELPGDLLENTDPGSTE